MKQVWVKRATWSATAAATAGSALPTLVTAMPEPRSISELPSTSTTHATAGGGRVHGHGHTDAGRDGGGLARLELGGARTRQGGHQTALLGQGGSTGEDLGYDSHDVGLLRVWSLDAEGMPARHCQTGRMRATLAAPGG